MTSASGATAAPGAEVMLAAAKVLAEEPFVHSTEVIDGTLRLYTDSGATAMPRIIRALMARGIEPGAIECRRPTLDDVFLAKTGRSLEERERAAAGLGQQ